MWRPLPTALLASLFALSACGFVYDEELDGPYHLVAVDDLEGMMVCRWVEGIDVCESVFPEGTVFAAGANSRFVVAGMHPRTWPDPPDKSTTHFYYLVRPSSEDDCSTSAVHGPFGAREFELEKRRRDLPAFSHVIDSLK